MNEEELRRRVERLEQLVQAYQEYIADIQIHCPIGKARIAKGDELDRRAREQRMSPETRARLERARKCLP